MEKEEDESLANVMKVIDDKGAVGVRKSRTASVEVADLMRTLKPRKKEVKNG